MPVSLNPHLLTVQPALPYFTRAEQPAIPAPVLPLMEGDPKRLALFDDWRSYIRQHFPNSPLVDQFRPEPILTLQPPRPEYHPSVSFIRDYPDQGQIAPIVQRILQAQDARLTYREQFAPLLPYPLAIHLNTYTRLPGFAYGTVQRFDPRQRDETITTANLFLRDNQAAFGFMDAATELRKPEVLGVDEQAELIHVRYQQWHQELPVYGGQVVMHMGRTAAASGSHPSYLSSGYLPIPPDRAFKPAIDAAEAIRRAKQALAAQLTSADSLALLAQTVGAPDPDANPQQIELLQQLAALAEGRLATIDALGHLKADLAQLRPDRARELAAIVDATYNVPAAFQAEGSPGAFDDYRAALAPWLPKDAAREPFDVPSLWFLHAQVDPEAARALGTLVTRRAQAAQRLRDLTQRLRDLAPEGQDPDVVPTLAAGLWQRWEDLDLPEWRVAVAPYAGEETFILPFAGDYHLAYRVELLAPTEDDGWRIFVDAETGDILGVPEHLLMHARQFYASSSALLNNPAVTSVFTAAELTSLVQDLAPTFDWKFHSDQGGGAIQVATIANLAAPMAPHQADAVNIAYHAWKTYRHMRDVGQIGIPHAPRLQVQVGRGGSTFSVGFMPTSHDFLGRITFQTHNVQALPQGLAGEGRRPVFTPSLDPDIVIHEVVHGLMWLVNPSPFDQRHDDVPFGRALLEGYATYLAHSLIARQDPLNESWASAAYRDPRWGDRWDLGIGPQAPAGAAPAPDEGVRALIVPNYYPLEETQGLPVYDVSMAWARALWDVRRLLAQANALGQTEGRRLDLADQLVLQSYLSVHGWSSNFEIAAEALIAAARTILQGAPWNLSEAALKPIVGQIIQAFAARGILADYGVQTLGQVNHNGQPVWLVGTDTGLKLSADLTLPWSSWTAITENGDALPGTVALVTGPGGSPVFIATEGGVFRWDNGQAGTQATRVGSTGLSGERVQSLLAAGGGVQAGTNRALWRFDAVANAWRAWDLDNVPRLVMGLKQVALPDPAGQLRTIGLVHTPHQVLWADINHPSWLLVDLSPAAGVNAAIDWITSIEVIDNTSLYVATQAGEVWPVTGLSLVNQGGELVLRGTVTAALVRGAMGSARVLQLVSLGGQHLGAAATAGVFEYDLTSAVGWTSVLQQPSPILVTALLRAGNVLVAGTAGGGLKVLTTQLAGGVSESTVPIDG